MKYKLSAVLCVHYTTMKVTCHWGPRHKIQHAAVELLLALEICWLRNILGVCRLQKLNQKETLREIIQQRRLTWSGLVERIEAYRIPHRGLHCYILGNRSRRRQRKTWWIM